MTEQRPVALVTGAARGIGLATARRFARDGYRVALLDISGDALAEAASRIPSGDSLVLVASVSDPAMVEAAVAEVMGACSRLDVVVNNAAVNRPGTALDQSDDDWSDVLAVNLSGAFHVSSAAARAMTAAGGGAIVNVGSIGGAGFGGSPAYAASKAGLIGLTKQAARELGPSGIRVNLVAPGVITTEWVGRHIDARSLETTRQATPLRRVGSPEDVAGVIAFLASADAAHVTGQVISVSGGLWMP